MDKNLELAKAIVEGIFCIIAMSLFFVWFYLGVDVFVQIFNWFIDAFITFILGSVPNET